MTRGKYASSAEARRARESAESEVEAGRRKIAALIKENEELRTKLATERADTTERLRKYAALMDEGSSPQVDALRNELASLRAAQAAERIERAHKVATVLAGVPWINAERRTLPRMAEALGVNVGDIFQATGDAKNRRTRRMTISAANLRQNIHEDPSFAVKR